MVRLKEPKTETVEEKQQEDDVNKKCYAGCGELVNIESENAIECKGCYFHKSCWRSLSVKDIVRITDRAY